MKRTLSLLLAVMLLLTTVVGTTVYADDTSAAASADSVKILDFSSQAAFPKVTQNSADGQIIAWNTSEADYTYGDAAMSAKFKNIKARPAHFDLSAISTATTDFTGYQALGIRFYAENAGDTFSILLNQTANTWEGGTSYYNLYVKQSGWQYVEIPFRRFAWDANTSGTTADWSAKNGLTIKPGAWYENRPSLTMSGTIYIDSISLVKNEFDAGVYTLADFNTADNCSKVSQNGSVTASTTETKIEDVTGENKNISTYQSNARSLKIEYPYLTSDSTTHDTRPFTIFSYNMTPSREIENASLYHKLAIRLYADTVGDSFMILLNCGTDHGQAQGYRQYTYVIGKTGWQLVEIPLASFKNGSPAPESWKIKSVGILPGTFTDGMNLYFDEIMLCGKKESNVYFDADKEGYLLNSNENASSDYAYGNASKSFKVDMSAAASAEIIDLAGIQDGGKNATLEGYGKLKARLYVPENVIGKTVSLCIETEEETVKEDITFNVAEAGWYVYEMSLSGVSKEDAITSIGFSVDEANAGEGQAFYVDKIWLANPLNSSASVAELEVTSKSFKKLDKTAEFVFTNAIDDFGQNRISLTDSDGNHYGYTVQNDTANKKLSFNFGSSLTYGSRYTLTLNKLQDIYGQEISDSLEFTYEGELTIPAVTFTVTGTSSVKASTKITNSTNETKPITLFVAAYDKNDNFISAVTGSYNYGEGETLELYKTNPNVPADGYVKAFIWNRYTLEPITTPVTNK